MNATIDYSAYISQMDTQEKQALKDESIGTLKDIFGDKKCLPVFNSKAHQESVINGKGPKLATLIYDLGLNPVTKKEETAVVCLGKALSALVRAGEVTLNNIVAMPVFWNEEKKSMFVGMPGMGWFNMAEIRPITYKPKAISNEQLAGLD